MGNHQNGTFMCDCSSDKTFELTRMSVEERVNGTSSIGMKQIVALPFEMNNYGKFKDIGPEGMDLVNWCIDFLQLKSRKDRHGDSTSFPKYFYEKEKGWFLVKSPNDYITISSFIRFFLKIEDGYDHWLMNFLDWNKVMEHGSSIRSGWYNRNHFKGYKFRRHVKKERKRAILNWIENAPVEWDWSEGTWESKKKEEKDVAVDDVEKAAEEVKLDSKQYSLLFKLACAQSMDDIRAALDSKT